MIGDRLRLLRLLRSPLLVVLQLVRAVLPAGLALAVGRLLDAPSTMAAIEVAALFFADQLVWLGINPVRFVTVKRIDGALRARVRSRAAGLRGLDELESDDFQDRAARAVDAGMGMGRDRSAGAAAVGQLELLARILSAVAAAAVVATFSVLLAVMLLALALGARAVVRRQWIAIVDRLDADTAGQRHEYYIAEQAVIGAGKDVRLFGLSDWFGGRFRAASVRTWAPVWRAILTTLRGQWWVAALIVAGGAAALGIPAAAVLRGELDPARLATLVLAGLGVLAISRMGMEAFDIEYGLRGLKAADELDALFAATEKPKPTNHPADVRFDDVTFTYPGATTPVLDGLSVTLRAGETVAVVGANGAGKTTFVKLLAGLYAPDSGRITVGGVDPRTRRPPVAALFQDFVHYPASLRDNVTAGRPADDDAIRAALDRAGAPDLPLDTDLWREGGHDLSGGQWQRVALARVLYAGASILILDEPTAHLDVRAEAEFHERVVSRVTGATTILISHRLSTVRPAERILLLRDGRIAEDGTHDELLARGGDYARFFTTQAAAFTTGEDQ